MPRKKSIEVRLTAEQRKVLDRWQRAVGGFLRGPERADIVIRAAHGQTNYRIAKELGISRNTVKHWRYRFAREGMEGLKTRPIPGRPKKVSLGVQDVKFPKLYEQSGRSERW